MDFKNSLILMGSKVTPITFIVKTLNVLYNCSVTLTGDPWEDSAGDPCPRCKKPTLRFVGRFCRGCSHVIPQDLARFLNQKGMPSTVDGYTVKASLLGQDFCFEVSPTRAVVFCRSAPSSFGRLVQGLEQEIALWAQGWGFRLANARNPS